MALKKHDFFTVVEIGTSKIAVVHCELDEARRPVVTGFGVRPSGNCIMKGGITDLAAASRLLTEAFADADSSAGMTPDREDVYFLISGPGILSRQGEGNVMIYDKSGIITREYVEEAVQKAMTVPLPPGQVNIDTLISYYVLDSRLRVREPVGHSAQRLDASIHIVTIDQARLDVVRTLLREQGFEGAMNPVFTGMAAAYDVLNSDEKEHGTLLIDLGAGLAEYVFVHDDGVIASGVIPVGMDNLANDLSVGLDLTMEQARRIVQENGMDGVKAANQEFLTLECGDCVRQIPLSSLEKITDIRMIELFSLIREELKKASLLPLLRGGVVLTGGGASFRPAAEYAGGVFGTHVRIGEIRKLSGAVTGLDDPRFAALTGSLRYIADLMQSTGNGGAVNQMESLFENLAGGVMDQFKNMTRVFRQK